MKRFSLTTLSILISIISLTPEGAMAEIDGLLNVESTNPSILRVTHTRPTDLDDHAFAHAEKAYADNTTESA